MKEQDCLKHKKPHICINSVLRGIAGCSLKGTSAFYLPFSVDIVYISQKYSCPAFLITEHIFKTTLRPCLTTQLPNTALAPCESTTLTFTLQPSNHHHLQCLARRTFVRPVHACNPGTGKGKAGDLEFKVNLNHTQQTGSQLGIHETSQKEQQQQQSQLKTDEHPRAYILG